MHALAVGAHRLAPDAGIAERLGADAVDAGEARGARRAEDADLCFAPDPPARKRRRAVLPGAAALSLAAAPVGVGAVDAVRGAARRAAVDAVVGPGPRQRSAKDAVPGGAGGLTMHALTGRARRRAAQAKVAGRVRAHTEHTRPAGGDRRAKDGDPGVAPHADVGARWWRECSRSRGLALYGDPVGVGAEHAVRGAARGGAVDAVVGPGR